MPWRLRDAVRAGHSIVSYAIGQGFVSLNRDQRELHIDAHVAHYDIPGLLSVTVACLARERFDSVRRSIRGSGSWRAVWFGTRTTGGFDPHNLDVMPSYPKSRGICLKSK